MSGWVRARAAAGQHRGQQHSSMCPFLCRTQLDLWSCAAVPWLASCASKLTSSAPCLLAPCAAVRACLLILQVVQTVTAEYFRDSQTSVQASNTANLFITGPSCPVPPAGYIIGSTNTVVDTTATSTASATTPTTTTTTNTASGSSPTAPVPSSTSTSSSASSSATELTAPPPGLSVVLSDIQTMRSAAPVWELTMQPADNDTVFEPGKAGTVNFKLSWSKLPQVWLDRHALHCTKTKSCCCIAVSKLACAVPVSACVYVSLSAPLCADRTCKPSLLPACTPQATDYSGAVTVINNANEPAELDGVYVTLLNTLADGEATDEAAADCPVGVGGALGQVTGANPYTVPANGRLACKFSLRSVNSGALVGTATATGDADSIVSKQAPVPKLLADGSCGKLLSGLAASELGQLQGGVLLAAKGVTEEEVCSAGSSTVKIAIPADATPPTNKGCVVPVSDGGHMSMLHSIVVEAVWTRGCLE